MGIKKPLFELRYFICKISDKLAGLKPYSSLEYAHQNFLFIEIN